ncbi:hypothetical protein Q5O24_11975 [Eubacteriaceae bacterium ES3]|nr:hypothetical protein Q5O24_11975 [Eubacteriaceae bacterium ES3]
MSQFRKICTQIGNDSLLALFENTVARKDFEVMAEYIEIIDKFDELLAQIEHKNIRYGIEEINSNCVNIAMYQGFVLGFNEAVSLLTGGLKDIQGGGIKNLDGPVTVAIPKNT